MTDSKKTFKCPHCKKIKALTERVKNRRQCKRCKLDQRNRWAHANRPTKAEHQRRWRAGHFFKHRASYLKPCTGPMLAGLWKNQRGCCALTGEKLTRDTAHLDHIYPRCKGGGDELENVQWVSVVANTAKGGLTQADFLKLCRAVVKYHGEEEEEE